MVITYGENNEYHVLGCCPVCEGGCEVSNEHYINYDVCEANIECKKCGHKNHWAYGHYVENWRVVENEI